MGPYYQLINELVVQVGKFEKEKKAGEARLEDFILWLNRQILFNRGTNASEAKKSRQKSLRQEHLKKVPSPQKQDYAAVTANVQLALLIHMLSKHFKVYLKKVLHDTDLVSMDGHTFLSSLYHTDSMRKMELIRANYSEVPSGVEVIKRLLRKGFIEEFDDPDDKRSRRVRITNKGRKELEASLPDMLKVIDIMGGDLDENKKMTLNTLLDELNEYHNNRFDKAKSQSLDELLSAVKR